MKAKYAPTEGNSNNQVTMKETNENSNQQNKLMKKQISDLSTKNAWLYAKID